MYKLFERAKPDDADLLSEIQNIDPAVLTTIKAVRNPLPLLALKVVDWLQVSPVFVSTHSIKLHDDLTTYSQKCRHPPHATISLWNCYVDNHDSNEDDSDFDDDDSNSR